MDAEPQRNQRKRGNRPTRGSFGKLPTQAQVSEACFTPEKSNQSRDPAAMKVRIEHINQRSIPAKNPPLGPRSAYMEAVRPPSTTSLEPPCTTQTRAQSAAFLRETHKYSDGDKRESGVTETLVRVFVDCPELRETKTGNDASVLGDRFNSLTAMLGGPHP